MIKLLLILYLVLINSMINISYGQEETESLNVSVSTVQHTLELNESEKGQITLAWETNEDFEITRVTAKEYSDWFGFRLTPFTLKGHESNSVGVIDYEVRAPEKFCDKPKGISVYCVNNEENVIEIMIEGIIGNTSIRINSEIVVLVKQYDYGDEIFYSIIIIGIIIGIITLIGIKKKQRLKITGYRNQQKSGTFLKKLKNHS